MFEMIPITGDEPERIASARLIAAAPDLFEALTHALGVIVEFGDLNGFRNTTDEELGALVTAVAKEAGTALNKALGNTQET